MTRLVGSITATIAVAVVLALVDVATPATAVATIGAAAVFVAAANRTAWFATRRPAHVAAVALVLEGLVLLAGNYAWHLAPMGAVAVAFITIDAALGLVIVAALTAVAFELRSALAIAGVLAWLIGWIGVGATELWVACGWLFGRVGELPDVGVISPVMFALGGVLIGWSLASSQSAAAIARWCAVFLVASVYVLVDQFQHHAHVRASASGDVGVAVAWFALAMMLKRWQLPPSPVPRAIISTSDSR